jgi:hypothetical protein
MTPDAGGRVRIARDQFREVAYGRPSVRRRWLRELAFVVDNLMGSPGELDGVGDLAPGASTGCTPVDRNDYAVAMRGRVHFLAESINRLGHDRGSVAQYVNVPD